MDVTGIALSDTPASVRFSLFYLQASSTTVGWLVGLIGLVQGAKHLHMAFTGRGGWRFYTTFCMYQKVTGAMEYHKNVVNYSLFNLEMVFE